MRQLAMNCCEGCGLYCNSSSGSCHTLTIERAQLNFCGPTCIGTFKQVCSIIKSCSLAKSTQHAVYLTNISNAAKVNLYITGCVFVQTCRKMVECAYCHKMAIVSTTIMERDQKGKVQLYCSSVCVEQSRPPQHILSGRTHDRDTHSHQGLVGISMSDYGSLFLT